MIGARFELRKAAENEKEAEKERGMGTVMEKEKATKGFLYDDAIRAWTNAAGASSERRGVTAPVPASAVPASVVRGPRTPRNLISGKTGGTVPGVRGRGWVTGEYGDDIAQGVGRAAGANIREVSQSGIGMGSGGARKKRRVFSWREWSGVGW